MVFFPLHFPEQTMLPLVRETMGHKLESHLTLSQSFHSLSESSHSLSVPLCFANGEVDAKGV